MTKGSSSTGCARHTRGKRALSHGCYPYPCPAVQVFRAACDLKQRRLAAECLALLLPQYASVRSDTGGQGGG